MNELERAAHTSPLHTSLSAAPRRKIETISNFSAFVANSESLEYLEVSQTRSGPEFSLVSWTITIMS